MAIVANGQPGEDVLQVGAVGNIAVTGGDITHSDGVIMGTFSGGTAGNDLIITFNANATKARVRDLLSALQYQNSDDITVNTAARTIQITVDDGDGDISTSAGQNVTINLVRAPIIDLDDDDSSGATGHDYQDDFTEGGGPVPCADTDNVITDDGTYKAIIVTLTNRPDGAAESIASTFGSGAQMVNGENVTTGLYDNGTGVLTISIDDGSAVDTTMQDLIGSIRYNNASEAPDTTNRLITFAGVDDADHLGPEAIATITVTAVNDAPTFTGLDGTPGFTEEGVAVTLDSDVTVTDIELDAIANYDGATLTLLRNGGAVADDQFSAGGTLTPLTQGILFGLGGADLGTVTTNSGGVLLLNFNGNATGVDVNTVLQSILYSNASDAPPAIAQIDWAFNDGNTGPQGTGGALFATGSVTVTITGVNDQPIFINPPAITGNPVEGLTLSLVNTTATDADGDSVTLTYQWRSDTVDIGGATNATLVLSAGDVGKIIDCEVTGDDGQGQGNSLVVMLTTGVTVQPDSDGDGVPDGSDICPGGNDTIDVDHDRIPDDCDSSLPPITYTVAASHVAHGIITPAGPQTVIEGNTMQFTLTPEAGYAVSIVEGSCGGTLSENIFITARILKDCTVIANFDTAPDRDGDGIIDSADSCPDDSDNDADHDGTCGNLDAFPNDPALSEEGIDLVWFNRPDGGDDGDNLVNGNPRLDVGYDFTAIIDNPEAGSAWLVIDGYPQQMDCGPEPVDFTVQVTCSLSMNLGPVGSHSYHIEVRVGTVYDPSVPPLSQSNEMPGPVIELLHGTNMIGLAKALEEGLDLDTLVGSSRIYRWVSQGLSSTGNNGRFEYYDGSWPYNPGQAYFMERQDQPTLPDLTEYPDYTASEFGIDLQPGWNLIANPYGGQIPLTQVRLQVDDEAPILWLDACADNLLLNGIYWYQGDDWGDIYAFESAGGDPDAVLVPWRGYWIYVVQDGGGYRLIIPKP
ncbi:MAG: hypothetical protein KJ950_17665 [Proteobacteria bacterium]|nr:hypothetical protein [Pseudomonadota bacterium]MBU1686860.1 hypothetical protein [Pseudomonadota bacterium]